MSRVRNLFNSESSPIAGAPRTQSGSSLSPELVDNLPSNVKQVSIIHEQPVGSSGVQIYAGYYSEDYLRSLSGMQRADFFDKMRRSDPKTVMLLGATKSPILGAEWSIEAASEEQKDQQIAKLVEHILFKGMDDTWLEFVFEALSFIDFGHSVFERIDKPVIGHPEFGNYVGIKALAFRSQRTIDRWNLDPQTGKLISISQQAFGDLGRLVDIPAEYLLVFTSKKEGDNYEGISWLRPCIGAFKRKEHHLKIEAIGQEKYAIPTPVLDVPSGKEESPEFSRAEEIMKRYVTHQQQYITKPADWKIDFIKTDFDASKIRESINAEDTSMVDAFLANFLDLAKNGSGGSYALGQDLSDFFLNSIEHLTNYICQQINKCLIPQIVKLNFGPQASYPQLKCSGVTDKAGKEFAEVIQYLIQSKAIIPDDKLETDLRKRYKLPKKSDEGQRDITPAAQSPASPQPSLPSTQPKLSEKSTFIKMSETPKAQIKADKDEIQEVMEENLVQISEKIISQLMSKYKASTEANKLTVIKDIGEPGIAEYKKALLEILAQSASKAIKNARAEVPKARDVKFTEKLESIKLAEFEKLPPEVQRMLKARSELLVGTQLADLKKNIFFAYQASVLSTDSDAQIEFDLNQSSEKYLTGPAVVTGAGNIASQVINDSRNAFFFDDEVSEEIESFTFVNGDPVSPICQDLAGTVFAKDDPNADRYWPPLHHNCKSYIVPNLKGKKNPELSKAGLKPSKSSLEKYVTLAEGEIIPQDGITVQSIVVSKKYVGDMEAAKQIAHNYRCDTTSAQELEDGYKFINKDPSMFIDGSQKSFEPMAGVTVFVGLLKV